MASVKIVISLLCKYLNMSFNVNIKPEHFRLAKFDKVEENTVGHLWQILHKVLSRIIKPNPIFTDEDLPVVAFVKLHLTLLNYDSIEFYCLPSDMSHGSRELLLAFSWLLVTKNVFESVLLDKLKKSTLRKEFVDKATEENEEDPSEEPQPLDLEGELNFILWAVGSIRNNYNAIAEADNARVKDMAQVHQSTLHTCGLRHLSVFEAQLLQRPQLLQAYLADAEADVLLIETHKQWASKSHVFWEWMGSVLLEKKDSSQSHSGSVDQKSNLIEIMNFLRLQLKTYVCGESGDASESLPPPNLDGDDSNGMPRFIFAPKEKKTELGKWLLESEKLVQMLSEQSRLREADLRKKLHKMSIQMEDIDVIGKN